MPRALNPLTAESIQPTGNSLTDLILQGIKADPFGGMTTFQSSPYRLSGLGQGIPPVSGVQLDINAPSQANSLLKLILTSLSPTKARIESAVTQGAPLTAGDRQTIARDLLGLLGSHGFEEVEHVPMSPGVDRLVSRATRQPLQTKGFFRSTEIP